MRGRKVWMKGKVYLIGAGPGDPGLITLRGVRCLQEADVVIYDHLANPRLLSHAKPGAELIYAGKKGGEAVARERRVLPSSAKLARQSLCAEETRCRKTPVPRIEESPGRTGRGDG